MKISGTYKSIIHYYLINLILKKNFFCPQMEEKTSTSLIIGWLFVGIFSGSAFTEVLPPTTGTGIDQCLTFFSPSQHFKSI